MGKSTHHLNAWEKSTQFLLQSIYTQCRINFTARFGSTKLSLRASITYTKHYVQNRTINVLQATINRFYKVPFTESSFLLCFYHAGHHYSTICFFCIKIKKGQHNWCQKGIASRMCSISLHCTIFNAQYNVVVSLRKYKIIPSRIIPSFFSIKVFIYFCMVFPPPPTQI